MGSRHSKAAEAGKTALLLAKILFSAGEHGRPTAIAPVVARVLTIQLVALLPSAIAMPPSNPEHNLAVSFVIAQTDALLQFYLSYVDLVNGLSSAAFLTPVRAGIALGLSTAGCGIAHRCWVHSLSRGVFVPLQWAVALLGFLAAMELPLERISLYPSTATWIFSFSWFAILVFPWALSYLLCHRRGWRMVLGVGIYACLALMFITQHWRQT